MHGESIGKRIGALVAATGVGASLVLGQPQDSGVQPAPRPQVALKAQHSPIPPDLENLGQDLANLTADLGQASQGLNLKPAEAEAVGLIGHQARQVSEAIESRDRAQVRNRVIKLDETIESKKDNVKNPVVRNILHGFSAIAGLILAALCIDNFIKGGRYVNRK